MINFRAIFLIALFTFSFFSNSLAGIPLIRDAETEKFLRDITNPILKIADLEPQNVTIYIVNDNSLNAFVTGGQNIFINTGLIRKYQTPDTLIGVIAHETGHIAGGHLARSKEGMKEANSAMLLSYLLGIGAALSGSPDAGAALIMGGSQSAQRLYTKYTRGQEEAADQYAIKYLDKLRYPATGLINLLEYFEQQLVGYKGQIDEYLLTHPISKKRIDLIKARTKGDNFSDKKINSKFQPQMDDVLAKLEGFIDNPDQLLEKYKNKSDDKAKYIKSIALYRIGKIDEAIKLLDEVIENTFQKSRKTTISRNYSKFYVTRHQPSGYYRFKLGFLFELKGQILFEGGKMQDSVIAYNKAINLLPNQNSSLAKLSFATSILEINTSDKELINRAIRSLIEAKKYEKQTPMIFKQLANAYSRISDDGLSLLNLAEFNLLKDEKEKARKYAKEAKKKIKKSDKINQLRADDIVALAKEDEDD